ncbi:MAG: hypothetical protein JWN04_5294 [Myxococcaceae bacterium]|nr:hypothetical protein [Myxococcaceae bacterium]
MKSALLALSLMLWAPYQCGTEPNERPQEDSAPKALWVLADKFESEGNSAARATTLNQLVEQYPSSHYAEKARIELGLPARANNRTQGAEKPEKSDAPEPASDAEQDPESGDK